MNRVVRGFLFSSLVVATLLSALSSSTTSASQLSWTTATLDFRQTTTQESGRNNFSSVCEKQEMLIVRSAKNPVGDLTDTCFYDYGDWGIGRYTTQLYWYSTPSERWAVRLGDSGALHVLNTRLNTDMVMVPSQDGFVRNLSSWNNHSELLYYEDFPSMLRQVVNQDNIKAYEFDRDGYSPLITRPNGESVKTVSKGVALSSDSGWMALNTEVGLVRVNLDTGDVLRFENMEHSSWDHPSRDFAITNDGKHIAVMGSSNVFSYSPGQWMYDISSACGDSITDDMNMYVSVAKPCAKVDLREVIRRGTIGPLNSSVSPRFEDNGKALVLNARGDSYSIWGRLTMVKAQSLEYLAMGDSISSGEGDTLKGRNKNSWYRAYTDEKGGSSVPREKCHISTRSYPYLLAEKMKLSNSSQKTWESVACSGARMVDIKTNSYPYLGQPRGSNGLVGSKGVAPRLQGFDAAALQGVALNEFIPGRAEQIDFVKTHKPRVITLTAGANDIGFGDKISSCAGSPITCEWVNSKIDSLAGQIQNTYTDLKGLYTDIHDASGGKAKIYAVGYPVMFYEGRGEKCSNTMTLNNKERRMMIHATHYLNEVIEHAANAAGVTYIDVTHALRGGRLCDKGQKYMNGVSPIQSLNAFSARELQESVHPNHLGHKEISESIRQWLGYEDLRQFKVCAGNSTICPKKGPEAEKPPVPDSLGGQAKNSFAVRVVDWVYEKGKKITAKTESLKYFKPRSFVKVMLHSDPVDIGSFTADDEGDLSFEAEIPDKVPAGHHTLVMEGVDAAGDPVELTQALIVVGADPNDRDENGIPDDEQKCGLFLPDDACDDEESEAERAAMHRHDKSKLLMKHTYSRSQVVPVLRGGETKEAFVASNKSDRVSMVSDHFSQYRANRDDEFSSGGELKQNYHRKAQVGAGSEGELWVVIALALTLAATCGAVWLHGRKV